jgi:hypothetical protein
MNLREDWFEVLTVAIVIGVVAFGFWGCLGDDRPKTVDCERAQQRLADMQECLEHRGCVVEERDYSWIKRQVRRCENSFERVKAEVLWCTMSPESQARAVRELGATPQECVK